MAETDRELLELAAKSADMDYLLWTPGASPLVPLEHRCGDRICWNPLTDDGDALRLAVKLGIYVEQDFDRIDACKGDMLATEFIYQLPGPTDRYAATRRAIVRAAAAIGKGAKP